MSISIPETVAKSRTIDGLPCILVESETPNASGHPSRTHALAVFADNEFGNALADELVERLNSGEVRL